jgi:ABC-type amino acid transport substrate-binding protein
MKGGLYSMRRLLLFLWCALLFPCAGNAANIDKVIVVGPSWEKFTNLDGTGLYHEILNEVFGLYGINVIREYVPSERAYDLVRAGRADMMTCHDVARDPLQLAKYPMFAGPYHVFFNKKRIGEWKGEETLRDRTLVWRIGYYSPANFPVHLEYKEVKTGGSALGMVLLGRVDFYVDDLSFIETSIKENKIPFDMADYDIRVAGYRTYHPVLLQSQRGNQVKALYDQGMERLIRNGRLREIFAKWGFEYPPYTLD